MSRINTNVSSMLAQRTLGMQNQGLTKSLERLSTGLRINRGADNPAGLIASETLRAEKAALTAAIGNAQRAEQVVNVAEGGLQEINNLLVELQSLIGESANAAGVSAEEKEANQSQIDSILSTIDRIASATSFNGTNLLNGNLDYTTTGVNGGELTNVEIHSAKVPENGSMAVSVQVTNSAARGEVFMFTNSAITNGGDGSITIEVVGSKGSQQFTFASGTTQANIITAVNTFTEATGVHASTTASGVRVMMQSTQFGADHFVRARVINGTSTGLMYEANTGGTGSLDLNRSGRDAAILINGQEAITKGLSARVTSDGLSLAVSIDTSINNGGSSTFNITGGGANFNLSPKVSLAGKTSLGIGSVTTGNLGNGVVGMLSNLKAGGASNVVTGDLSSAQEIVDAAVKQVAGLRGRLGAFQKNTVAATMNNLGVALENTAAAESVIRDTDFASETAMLTRQQILSQAATQALAIANAQPQAVLSLLG